MEKRLLGWTREEIGQLVKRKGSVKAVRRSKGETDTFEKTKRSGHAKRLDPVKRGGRKRSEGKGT